MLSACSLRYEQQTSMEDKIPEFLFENVSFERYLSGQKSFLLEAQVLEQYKRTNESYGKNVSFYNWNEDGEVETTGSCDMLGIDPASNIYLLFNNVFVQDIPNELEIKGQHLKWNGNTEQLTTDSLEKVYIKHKDLTLEGSGFSASGISKTFSFTGQVNGVYEDKKED